MYFSEMELALLHNIHTEEIIENENFNFEELVIMSKLLDGKKNKVIEKEMHLSHNCYQEKKRDIQIKHQNFKNSLKGVF